MDETARAGLDGLAGVTSLAWIDANADERLDLHVVAGGAHRVFTRDPSGLFVEVELGLGASAGRARAGSAGVGAGNPSRNSNDESTAGEASDRGRGSATDSLTLGATSGVGLPGTSSAAAGPPAANILSCVSSLRDQDGGDCIEASREAVLGSLYPLSTNFFVEEGIIPGLGRVGIGTTTPQERLDVDGSVVASGNLDVGFNITGQRDLDITRDATVGGELDVTGGSDVTTTGGGFLQLGANGDTNIAIDDNEIMARDAGGAATLNFNADGGRIVLGGNSNTERVGIGTTSPSAKVDIFGSSTTDVFRVRVDGTTRLVLDGNGTLAVGSNFTPSYDLQISSSAPNGGTAAKPGGGSWSSSSDRRLKKNIEDLEGALETLLALRGVTFEYKDPESIDELFGTRVGFIAQEVEEVIPDWVDEKPDGMKMVTVRGFEALVVEALRELETQQSRELEALRAEVRALREENAAMRAGEASLAQRIAALEQRATSR